MLVGWMGESMFGRYLLAAFAAMLLCAGAPGAAPLEAYGRLPTLSQVALSPDGTSIAYVRAGEVKRWGVVQKLGAAQPMATMDVGDQKLRWLEWADNAHVIITVSSYSKPKIFIGKRYEWFVPTVIDLAKGTQYGLFDKAIKGALRYSMMNISAGGNTFRTVGGHTMVYSPAAYFPDPNRPNMKVGLFRVDLTDGDVTLASRPMDTSAESWMVDEAGNVLAVTQYFETDEVWRLSIYHKNAPDIRIDFKASIETPGIDGFTEDGKAIIMRLPEDLDERPLYERVSLTDGSRTPWRRDQDIRGVGAERLTGRAISGGHSVETTDVIFFDQRDAAMWQAVKAAFKNTTDVSIESGSDDHTKFVVKVFGPTYGNGYFFLDMTAHKATAIGREYDAITQVFEEKWIDYKAADGRVIHAYLTLPPNREAKNLPLLVFPHGGPQARDFPGFDWLSQAFASLGYVVLQPEFRGSGGFGKDLLWAGFGEIGKKMQTDLSDGVRALAAQGLIDPKRVCIGGASYGGYAALAGATLDTGVYRCAISISGVSDMRKQVRHWKGDQPKESPDIRFWKRFLGVTDLGESKIDAINPVNFASKITIPVLLVHGEEDTTVPFDQSVDMSNAMKSAGKPVEFVRLKGEDHHMSRSATRLQMLKAVGAFLQANNPPN